MHDMLGGVTPVGLQHVALPFLAVELLHQVFEGRRIALLVQGTVQRVLLGATQRLPDPQLGTRSVLDPAFA